jgi:hypothetical protein
MGINAIPDSEDLYAEFDILKESGYSDGQEIAWSDQSGNGRDASVVGSPTYQTGGSIDPGAKLDGADDAWVISSANWGSLTQPITFYLVADFSSISGRSMVFSDEALGDTNDLQWDDGTPGWLYQNSTNDMVGSSTVDRRILSVRLDGSNTVLREDGTQTDNVTDDNGIEEVNLGYDPNQGRYADTLWAAAYFFDAGHSDATMADVESYANGRFNLGLSL